MGEKKGFALSKGAFMRSQLLPAFLLSLSRPIVCLLGFVLLLGYALQGTASAQDILIFRTPENNQTSYKKEDIILEVEISAFEPILQVKINGEIQPVSKASFVTLKKDYKLEEGDNTIRVEVFTEFDSATKEFEITLNLPKVDTGRTFRLINVLGYSTISNVLKQAEYTVSDPTAPETKGTKQFLVVIPQMDWKVGKNNTYRIGGLFSRDIYDHEDMRLEQISFNQLNTSFILRWGEGSRWTVGMALNHVAQDYDNIIKYKNTLENDVALFTSLRFGLGKKQYWEVGYEYKKQEFLGEPAEGEEQTDEDGSVNTLSGEWLSNVSVFRGKLKGSYATFSTQGEFKRKTVLRLSYGMDYLKGSFLFGFGIRAKQSEYDVPDPEIDPVNFPDGIALSETNLGFLGNVMYLFSPSWMINLDVLKESQTANYTGAEYGNTAMTTSLIMVF